MEYIITIKESSIYLNKKSFLSIEEIEKEKYLGMIPKEKLEEIYCECIESIIYDFQNNTSKYKYSLAKEKLLEEFNRRENK